MASPIPKKPAQRQRRNRTTTAATLEAGPALKPELPDFRVSAIMCADCSWPAYRHTNHAFRKAESEGQDVDPHDFVSRPLAWKDATRKWWDVIWASPMVEEWVDADIPGLLALAVLVDEFWTSADRQVHAEMRQASREFGLSPLSRRQLQWEVKRLETPKPAPTKAPPAPRRSTKGSTMLSVLQGKAS